MEISLLRIEVESVENKDKESTLLHFVIKLGVSPSNSHWCYPKSL